MKSKTHWWNTLWAQTMSLSCGRVSDLAKCRQKKAKMRSKILFSLRTKCSPVMQHISNTWRLTRQVTLFTRPTLAMTAWARLKSRLMLFGAWLCPQKPYSNVTCSLIPSKTLEKCWTCSILMSKSILKILSKRKFSVYDIYPNLLWFIAATYRYTMKI